VSTVPSVERFDVAIAGGGPAGAAGAIVLARAGVRVLLVDAHPEGEAARIGEGLSPSANSLLRGLGLLEQVLADGHQPSPGTIAFWGSDAGRPSDFLYQLHGQGLQLDRMRFDAQLCAAGRAAGAELIRPAHLTLLSASRSERTLHQLRLRRPGVAEDRLVEARWLIDASGRAAGLARGLGAKPRRHDRLLAFHLRLRGGGCGEDRDGRTWVEAVEDGWWYSALLPGGARIAAFLGDADLLERQALLENNGLWTKLQQTTHLRALCAKHGYGEHGQPRGVSAGSTELDLAAGPNWIAVGDAAQAFDPLSSKGIANALYTGQLAAAAILAHMNGNTGVIARYADHLREIYAVYRGHLRAFYAMEVRWPGSLFWKRRHVQPLGPFRYMGAESAAKESLGNQ
jgi:flavin-dependent dehydrogenase